MIGSDETSEHGDNILVTDEDRIIKIDIDDNNKNLTVVRQISLNDEYQTKSMQSKSRAKEKTLIKQDQLILCDTEGNNLTPNVKAFNPI